MFGRSLSFCSCSFSNKKSVCSVLLRFTASDYLFSIRKHFLIAYQFLYFCKILFFSHILKYRIDKSICCFFSDCTHTTCCKKHFAEFSAGTQNNRIWPRSSFSWRQRFNLCKSWYFNNISWSHQPVSYRYGFVSSQRHMSWSFLWLVSEGEGWLFILFILVELLTITI